MAQTVSLGFKVRDWSKDVGTATVASDSGAKSDEVPMKTAYPSMTIPGNKALARALKPGQKFTATVTFCVAEVAIRDRKSDSEDGPVEEYGGTRVELEAESMTLDSVKVADDSGETDGATALANFFGKKGKKGEEE